MNHKGLSYAEVQSKLNKFGPNEISEQDHKSVFRLFLEQLKSPLIYILLVAALISIILNEPKDAIFIIIVVAINTILGFSQEYKAENTLEKLKKSVSKNIKVIRESQKSLIVTAELVPGDIMILEPGVRIPADAILLEATEFMVDESMLTGESDPIDKSAIESNLIDTITTLNPSDKNKHVVFKGSAVLEGLAIALVHTTGNATYFGKIAKSLSLDFDPETPIKTELKKVSKLVTIFISIITIIIVFLGIVRDIHFEEIFMTAVALSVSTIPEGLIIALTITLALGMNRIMAKKAIVKNLPAAETLGDIDILCADKTGTLTEGNMQVTDVDFVDNKQASSAIILCNNDANFIDKALMDYVKNVTNIEEHEKILDKRVGLFPFSSLLKYTGAYTHTHIYAVGAPEVILSFCKNNDPKWHETVKQRARLGSRTIAIAIKEINHTPKRDDFKEMTFLGLAFVKDPVRKSAEASLKKLAQAGIDVKIITGDLKETSMSVLHSLDFTISDEEILSGQELAEIKTLKQFDNVILKTKLFYRTTPDQKMRIVESLQRSGKRVGMMGDGVNDAPALRKSEIGITVDNATDISKEVSDLVLLDSNFDTILGAVEEGRNIFQNLTKIMTYLFAGSLTETILILFSLLSNLPLPLLPLHLLWINLVEDGLPSLALSFEKSQKNLLSQKPRHRNSSILNSKVLFAIGSISLVLDIIYFIIYSRLLNFGYDLSHAQTFMFAGISISSLFFIFSSKTIHTNIWKEKLFDNWFLNISLIIGFLLVTMSILWTPLMRILKTTYLTWQDIGLIIFISLVNVAIVEVVKYILHKKGY